MALKRQLREHRLGFKRDPGLGVKRQRLASAASTLDEVLPFAVSAKNRVCNRLCGRDARRFVVAEHNRTRAVAEKDARRAVRPVEDARQALRTNDESLLVGIEVNEPARLLERVDEAGASRLEIERASIHASEHVLHDTCRRRKCRVVRRRGREDDKPDFLRRNIRHLERFLCGLGRHRRSCLAFLGDMSRMDAGVRIDPLVRRVERGSDIVVRDDFRR